MKEDSDKKDVSEEDLKKIKKGALSETIDKSGRKVETYHILGKKIIVTR